MTDHSTRRAAFLAAVRDAFDEHYPRARPENSEPHIVGYKSDGVAIWSDGVTRYVQYQSGCAPKQFASIEDMARAADAEVTLSEYAWLNAEGDLIVETTAAQRQCIWGFLTPDDLDRIAAACTAWAAIKRREVE